MSKRHASFFLLLGLFYGCFGSENDWQSQRRDIPVGTALQFFYPSQSGKVEGYLIRPAGRGPFPLIVLLHGHSFVHVGAPRVLPVAERLTEYLCYASLAVSLPGYGDTAVPGDESDRRVIRDAVVDGVVKVRELPWIDGSRTMLYGFSRGAVFAAAMAGEFPALRAVVLHSGAYDLPLLYEETASSWLRASLNPDGEAPPRLFSILPEVSEWTAPALILHGAKDTLIPANQAVLLSERLRELGKPYRSVLFPDAGHRLPRYQVEEEVIAFLKQHVGSACNLNGG